MCKLYKNNLLLSALQGEELERPPVWMMRQAGRYLPDFMRLKKQYSFFERVENPEMATEITLMPVEQIGVDAAIIFSDILVIPQALGYPVEMVDGKGPVLPKTVSTFKQVEDIAVPDVEDRLHYVMDAIKLTVSNLDGQLPLIGFAGAPWTILCYMVEGKGSKNFDVAKAFCYQQPEAAQLLLEKITQTTIAYLKAQVKAGAAVVQVFDSWAGLLSPEMFRQFSLPYLKKIADAVNEVPVILFAKGAWYGLEDLTQTNASAIGLDWTISPEFARQKVSNSITLQGNFDPSALLLPTNKIEEEVHKMIKRFGTKNYIANLGHGILPNVPVDNAKAFVNAVKNY